MSNISRNLKVFIWPVESVVGIEILQLLENFEFVEIIGLSSNKELFLDEKIEFFYIPNVTSDEVIKPYLEKAGCFDKNSLIFPAHDYVLDYLCETDDLNYIGSPRETITKTRSKKSTYSILLNSQLSEYTMNFEERLEKVEFPIYAKPEKGYGGQSHLIINNLAELESFKTKYSHQDYIFCEILVGEECTVECFTDFTGELIYTNPRIRKSVRMGTSVEFSKIQAEDSQLIQYLAQELSKLFGMRSAWYFQLKRSHNGEWKILEISSRLPGSSVWSRAHGVNLAKVALYDHLKHKQQIRINELDFSLKRYLTTKMKLPDTVKTIYVDLDGTLLLKSGLVVDALSFLSKMKQNNKNIICITKHQGPNLETELEEMGLSIYFDEIYHIKLTEKKSEFINDKNSIFIDDSFKEREEVASKLGIPTYGPEIFSIL